MEGIAQPIRVRIDIRKGLTITSQRTVLMQGDAYANRMIAELYEDENPVDLTGADVTGSFIRADGVEILLDGKIEGNEARILLNAHCYTEDGYYEARMKLKVGDESRTVMLITGTVRSKGSGPILDAENIIPSIDDIIAQYETMQEVTKAAQDAADAANSSARSNPYINATNHNWMVWNAETGRYEDTGIPATGPKGEAGSDGMTPYIGDNGNWWVGGTDTGTRAQGPAGANGTGSGTVTGVKVGEETYEPDPTGLVNLGAFNAERVGALPSGGTAKNSLKLSGKAWSELMLEIYPVGTIYMSVNPTSPASLFGGTWEQIEDRFLLGAGSAYPNGATGGSETVTLTVDQMPKHVHELSLVNPDGTDGSKTTSYIQYGYSGEGNTYYTNSNAMKGAGGGASHNNMPPYLVVHMWKRIG